jgi:adhesin transport system membrane fusion protein
MGWFKRKPSAQPLAGGAMDPAKAEQIKQFRLENARVAEVDVMTDVYQSRLEPISGWTRWAVYLVLIVLGSFIAWAALSNVEEVTSGAGRVVPTGREQVVQSSEAGVLAEMMVAEGDTVEAGQPLLRIDDVRLGANMKETQSRVDALVAAGMRLRAESLGTPLNFPAELAERAPILIRNETQTYQAKRQALDSLIKSQEQALRLAQEEMQITEPMAAKGLVSDLDVLRIRRAIADSRGRIDEARSRYRADAAAELARVEAELGSQSAALLGREDSFKRTVLRAPKRGIVKNVKANTIGGVVQVGQDLLEIVPLDEALLVETRIRPSDIAFLHPGLPAVVKITAYDSGIYGWLSGTLIQISADTLRDEVRRDETYYRVLVRTERSELMTPAGKPLPIIPGMLAQVDIKTGQKSVLSYLFKPILRAREALRER